MLDPIVYGKGTTEGIVSVHVEDDGSHVWIREAGVLREEVRPFFPFIFLDRPTLLRGFERSHILKRLSGPNPVNHIAVFNSVSDYYEARRHIQQTARSGRKMPEGVYEVRNMVQQYLMQTGETYYKGMTPDDLHRMQLDIEAYSADGFPQANIPEHEIIIVSITDNRGFEKVLSLRDYKMETLSDVPERMLLRDLVETIREVDPDVIEGHNIFGFDLDYIMQRCDLRGVSFAIGRHGEVPTAYPAKKRAAERMIEYKHVVCPGREIYDTYFAVIDYDVFARDMEGHSLKYAAKYFGVSPDNRTYVEGDDIARMWREDPDTLIRYALDDVIETRELAAKLHGAAFFTAQALPMSFQAVATQGTGAKIESLFVREYLRNREALPSKAHNVRRISGGYTDMYYSGIYGPIVYADVSSLYPSIMLNFEIEPEQDSLHVFRKILRVLTDLRLSWKAQGKALGDDDPKKKVLVGMEKSVKILINGFYGYLAYPFGIFADFDMADKVTSTGRDILRFMIYLITQRGGKVIEVDTDGVMFVPPEGMTINEAEAFVKSLTDEMPEGILIDFDGWAKTMLSYKKKNYALVEIKKDGSEKKKFKGGSLISRRYEPFLIELSKGIIEDLLAQDIPAIARRYREVSAALREGRMPIEKLSRTATLSEPIDSYMEKIDLEERNRAAEYELAIELWKKTGRKPRQGDRLTFYVCDRENRVSHIKAFEHSKLVDDFDPANPDYSIKWYHGKRLKAGVEKFQAFFTRDDFNDLFSDKEITDERLAEISILNRMVKAPEFHIIEKKSTVREA